MGIEQRWARLDPTTQQWLIDHNGEAIPGEVVTKIVEAGGPVTSDAWWAKEHGASDVHLPDDAVDWVETTANDES